MSEKKLLIIDDEENIRKMLRQSLEAEGYQTELALNGEEGLEKVKESDYDLILLDLNLPGMDGMEVLEKFRDDNIATPVLIITGYGSVDSAVKVMKLGAIDYLQKPFNPKDIKSQVQQILERKEFDSGSEESDDYESLIIRAKSAINQRDFPLAEDLLQKANNIKTERPEPFNLLGVLAEIRGKSGQAMKMYRAALDIDPTYKPAQENLERSSDFKSHPDEANLGEVEEDQEE
ncbi:MAG: response regulator [Halanaerobiaceae bacterium]